MPKPRYQFEAYLTDKIEERDLIRRELAARQELLDRETAEFRELTAKREQLEADFKRWKEELEQGLREGSWTAQTLSSRRDHIKRLRGDCDEARREELKQERAVRKAARGVEETRAELETVTNEVRVHEDRKENWLAELAKEALRKEQKEIEEMGQAMHERRNRPPRKD